MIKIESNSVGRLLKTQPWWNSFLLQKSNSSHLHELTIEHGHGLSTLTFTESTVTFR